MAGYDFTLDTSDLASRYEEISNQHQFVWGQKLVAALRIEAGERVLDVGAGTGALAEYVADIVGDTGRVHGIDPLPERISIACGRVRPQLSYEVGDAYALDGFADGSFDAIYLNAVFHWLPEKRGPLRAFHRLLKPGGRLGLSTISGEHPSHIRVVKERVFQDAVYASVVTPVESGPQPLTRNELSAALVETGFRDPQIEIVETRRYLPDGDAVIDFIESSSFGNFLHRLPCDLRGSARARIREELDRTQTAEGVPLGGKTLLAVAVK